MNVDECLFVSKIEVLSMISSEGALNKVDRSEELAVKHCESSKPFTMEKLTQVLRKLKNNKARDPWGLIYELFKPNLAGEDLMNSLLLLFNGMKKHLIIPDFLLIANISSIFKNKGQKSDLNNDRGIFGLSKIRNIFDKLLYSEVYPIINKSMSDSNIGGR